MGMTDIINHFKRRTPDPDVQAVAFALVADVLQDRRLTDATDLDATRAEMERAVLVFDAAAKDAGRIA
jgi:hypothetical protein